MVRRIKLERALDTPITETKGNLNGHCGVLLVFLFFVHFDHMFIIIPVCFIFLF